MNRFFSAGFLTLGCAAVLYWLAAGIAGGFGTSVLWVWAAAGTVLILLGLAERRLNGQKKYIRIPVLLLRCTVCLCALWFFAVESLILSSVTERAPAGADVVLILGAQVKGEEPGIALTGRLEAACTYLLENPSATAILCGGQGPGENITEAECMYRYLTRHGISDNRLIREENSTSTAENVRFALEIAPHEYRSAVVVTSHFHIYRSLLLAKGAGWVNVSGHAAPFSPLLTPHYMAREFLTLTADFLRGNLS